MTETQTTEEPVVYPAIEPLPHAEGFEPDNEAKRLRNMTPEVAVGEPSPEPVLDEEGAPVDPNLAIERQNLTGQTEWPEGDVAQTESPEPWRKPLHEREEPLDKNDENTVRNMTPEEAEGAPSADTIEPPPDPTEPEPQP